MTQTRRRGAELETAVYAATRKILANEGLAQLTFAKVADLAGTSKPVIYRHWQSPFELAIRAIQDKNKTDHHGRLDQLVLTGDSLAEDLYQVLKQFTKTMDTFGQTFIDTRINGLTTDQNQQLKDMLTMVKTIDINAIDNVLARAKQRHEIKTTELDTDIKLMPFDWIRYQRFSNIDVDEAKLTKLVHDLLIPSYLHLLA
ncbi:helix-turn-helix domain-containing protein [Lactiplantibacillus daowaiensis]|uniref:Helix-turn-helix domain-containing protein n=1 Tax=Lactiplantibacillus daowaiensis TaxID=2559918 RepID=A0ABW1S3W2_9LACO